MKNNLKILLVALLLASTSCNDFLEEDPRGEIEQPETYSSLNELYLNSVAVRYNDVGGNADCQGLQGTARGVYDLNTFTTDEAIMPTRGADWYDGGFWQSLYTHDWGGADHIGDTWNYLFKAILGCNRSIEEIDAYAAHHPGDDVSGWRAEVRGLRAMFYFYAMDLYGRVPLFTSSKPEVSELKLQPREKAFMYIVSELQAVAPKLSAEHSNLSGEYYGRFTQGAAYFLLAKLMLNAEVYSLSDWTTGTPTPGKEIMWEIGGKKLNTWQATVHYCELITKLGYSLEDDFAANFKVFNEYSKENIFTIPMNKYLYSNQFVYLFRSRHYNHASAMGLNGENGACATRDALVTFGLKENGDESELDPRFGLTYYSGQVYDLKGKPVTLDDGTPLVYEPWAVSLDVSGSKWEKTAGARMKKYEVDPNGTKDGKQSENDIVLFRYADVLLMQCEAMVRNGENGDELLNKVRSRVGAKPRTATLSNILAERQLELAWEGWRRNDMIRFGTFTGSYSHRTALPAESNHYTIVFPIPGETLNITGDSQNPGY